VLVGINLLGRVSDLPEVSLVAILDRGQGRVPQLGELAHPDGRRAARNVNGLVIM
jgi:excinuclease UvrABC helicase subunit UvrB